VDVKCGGDRGVMCGDRGVVCGERGLVKDVW